MATRVHIARVCAFFLALAVKADLTEGIVLYLPFDEGSGTKAKDWSANGFTATIEGAKWTKGQFGGALQFSGSDQWVEVAYDEKFNILEGITIGAWVTGNVPFAPEWRGILNAKKSTYGPYLLQTGGASCGELGIYFAGAWTWLRTVQSLERAKFHHIVGTYDQKSGMHIYYDGKLDDGAGSPGAKKGKLDPNTAEGLVIGHNYGLAGRFWDGVIDEVVLYNRGLSEAEVAELYKNPPVAQAVAPRGKLATVWGTVKGEIR
jgi:hypothetical protein